MRGRRKIRCSASRRCRRTCARCKRRWARLHIPRRSPTIPRPSRTGNGPAAISAPTNPSGCRDKRGHIVRAWLVEQITQECAMRLAEMPARDGVAILTTYPTAYIALVTRAHMKPGDLVLVTAAAGGVGSATVQLAKPWGAKVIAAAGGADKATICKALGADFV